MCLAGLVLLVFHAYIVHSSLVFHRVKQRSKVWFYLSWIPVVGWVSLLILSLLPALGGCSQCGWRRDGRFPLHCPECGWELAKPRYEEAPLEPGQHRIPFWLGHSLGGVFVVLFALALLAFTLWPVLRTWERWEYKVVKARVVEDPAVHQALGSPLLFGWPDAHWSWEQQTARGTLSMEITGPKGRGHLESAFESCALHGWHFTILSLVTPTGARLSLGDSHPEGRKAPPRGGHLCTMGTPMDEATCATMARLAQDPVLLAHLSAPLIFRGAPRLTPEGPDSWRIVAEFQHGEASAKVRGRLADFDAMHFSDLVLRLDGDSQPIPLAPGSAASWRPSSFATFRHRLGPTLKAYALHNAFELLFIALISVLALWVWVRYRKNRRAKAVAGR